MISNISSTYFDKLVVCLLFHHVLHPTSTVTLVTPFSFFFISLFTLLASLYLLLSLICVSMFVFVVSSLSARDFYCAVDPKNFEVCYSATTFRRRWHSFLLGCRSFFDDVKNLFFFFPCALQSNFFFQRISMMLQKMQTGTKSFHFSSPFSPWC